MNKIHLYSGYQRYQHQKDFDTVIDGMLKTDTYRGKRIVILAPRQLFAKSTTLRAQMIKFCLSKPNTSVGYLSIDNSAVVKMHKEIIAQCGQLVTKSNESFHFIEFINGSRIQLFSSGKTTNLRGYTIRDLLVIDESAFIQDEIYNMYVIPWTIAHQPLIILASTPRYRDGYFYKNYINENNIVFDWSKKYSEIFEIPENKKELLNIQETTPDAIFRSEYLGEWLIMENSIFGNFEHVLHDYNIDYYFKNAKNLYFGIDVASGTKQDYTVVTAFDENGRLVYFQRFNDKTQTQQIQFLTQLYKDNEKRISVFNIESNNLGYVFLELLKNNGCYPDSFYTSTKTKRKLIEAFVVAIQKNKIILPNNKLIIDEMNHFQCTYKDNGSVAFGAPSDKHDDIVISLLLSYNGYQKYQFDNIQNNNNKILYTV